MFAIVQNKILFEQSFFELVKIGALWISLTMQYQALLPLFII